MRNSKEEYIKAGIPGNSVLAKLPHHLLQFIKPQHYDSYTPEDHAVWRYVMRKNIRVLPKIAHESYLDGLYKTGISIESIPSMYGMNRILAKIGWAAVAVDGLIPTRAFLEFQAYNVLVIASEIRTLQDIEYTPIPDIIHESAGHAPIIANPEYAEFLRRLGQIGAKAIASSHDKALDRATRKLTELKEDPNTPDSDLAEAEEVLRSLQDKGVEPSEMTAIRNLHWWSVEYGLIGTPEQPKIYGAGLLSSIGESKWCMSEKVAKLPYSLEASEINFDYTKPQPQLFVTPDFAHLSFVLEEYANRMAVRTGGLEAVRKLIDSADLGTIELSTGIQISGVFKDVFTTARGDVVYLSTSGPSALAYRDRELIGHGIQKYPDGYGTPIGRLRGINLAIEDMSPRDLEAYDIYEGRRVKLEFEGEVTIEGKVITGLRNLKGKIILIRFTNCHVQHRGATLFAPDQGIFDMAVGKSIYAGYAGPADLASFDLITHEVAVESPLRDRWSEKDHVYDRIRKIRSGGHSTKIRDLVDHSLEKHPGEWLLLLELLEIAVKENRPKLVDQLEAALDLITRQKPEISHLIKDGIEIIEKQVKPANP